MAYVLIATEKPFAEKAISQITTVLEQNGFSYQFLEKYASKDEFLKAVKNAEALIVRSDKVDAEVIKALKNLKLLCGLVLVTTM